MKKSYSLLAAVTLVHLALGGAAFATNLPPGLTPSGGTDAGDYTLTASSSVIGNGTFTGSFDTATHALTIITNATGGLIFEGPISGTAVSPLESLDIFAGNNPVLLSGNNTFTGDVILEDGTLRLGSATALGGLGSVFRTNGSGTLDLNGQTIVSKAAQISNTTVFSNTSVSDASWSGNVMVQSNSLTFNASSGNISMSGNISGGGGVAKSGANTLTISGDNNTLSAVWNLQAGTLKFGSATSVGAGVGVSAAGTTLDLNGQTLAAKPLEILHTNTTITNSAGPTGTWAGTVTTENGNDLIIDASSGDIVISGQISGGGSITKNGVETLTLSSMSNSYTGSTTVNAGTVNFTGSTVFTVGANGVNTSINGTGTVILDGTFNLDLIGAGTTLGDTWNLVDTNLSSTWGGGFSVLGFSDLGGGLWERIVFGTNYQFSELSGQLSVIPVPEPSTWALLGLGAGFILLARRKAKLA